MLFRVSHANAPSPRLSIQRPRGQTPDSLSMSSFIKQLRITSKHCRRSSEAKSRSSEPSQGRALPRDARVRVGLTKPGVLSPVKMLKINSWEKDF